jgi:hypothetical protein
MLDTLVPIIATGVFTLAGVLLSAVLERSRSREKRLQTLFDKKVETYTYLVRQAHKILVEVVSDGDSQRVIDGGMKLLDELGDCALFASREVTNLALELATLAAQGGMEIEDKRKEIGALQRELRSRCQEELGMAEL